MKDNLFLVSYDYDLTKRLASKLADAFSMRVFDQRELFEFDNMPRTFSEIYSNQGREYVLKKYRSILKSEFDFVSTVFIADISLADNCYDVFYKIKLSNFVVYFHKSREEELSEIQNKSYPSVAEREFYGMDMSLLKEREELIEKDCADISVDVSGLSDDEIVDLVIEKMKKFYES